LKLQRISLAGEGQAGNHHNLKGSTMTTTLDIQRRLAALGYQPGPLDGIPGRQTIAAVKQFQRVTAHPKIRMGVETVNRLI